MPSNQHQSTRLTTPSGWVPIFGEFETTAQEIRFKGQMVPIPPTNVATGDAQEQRQPMFGLLLGNETLADGDITAEVEFDEVTPKTLCELAVTYDPNADHLVAAGLGGDPSAFLTIREFGGRNTAGQPN